MNEYDKKPMEREEELRALLNQLLQQTGERMPAPQEKEEAPFFQEETDITAAEQSLTEETAVESASEPKKPMSPAAAWAADMFPLLHETMEEDLPPEEDEPFFSDGELPLILSLEEDEPLREEETDDAEPEDTLPPAPARRNPLKAIVGAFTDNFFHRGDGVAEWVRKSVFWAALLVLIGSLSYIMYAVVIGPAFNAYRYNRVAEGYDPEQSGVVSEGNYPSGMLASFRTLYDQNPEVRGFISFHSASQKDFLKIEYPILYSGDNSKYLTTDFSGKRNKNGALFFDQGNTIEPNNYNNKVLVVYGHNMASGQMFAGLNKFIGHVNNARAAATFRLDTLFERNQYKVFAVVLADPNESPEWYFDAWRTKFSTNRDFLDFVEQLRARSLFDYPVDVVAGDQLVILSTCTAPSSAKISDGRLLVVARRIRQSESEQIDATKIVKNEDVIMPRAWYTKQGLELHKYYTDQNYTVQEPAVSSVGTTTSNPSGSTAPTEDMPSTDAVPDTEPSTDTNAVSAPASDGDTRPAAGGTTARGTTTGGTKTGGTTTTTNPPPTTPNTTGSQADPTTAAASEPSESSGVQTPEPTAPENTPDTNE